jgi:glycosyltransferase involved in cell wall biosynthesis
MNLPKVSIVIPSYKPGHFEQCLKSAIGQTYPHVEIMVSDNCPTEEIRAICARYPGVLYTRNSAVRDQNVLAALFMGTGQYVKPLFDDDLLHPFCVERMVAVMNADPDVQLVFSASQVVDSDNLRVETRRPFEASGSMPGVEMQRNMALGMRNFVGELSTVMYRRATAWQLGWQQLFRIGDHDFTLGLADVAAYCNLARGGKAFYIDEELSYFRRDQRLESNSNPLVNQNFGYCFSDYLDLLRVSHGTGLVSTDELLGQRGQVGVVAQQYGAIFPQVVQSHEHLERYFTALQGA